MAMSDDEINELLSQPHVSVLGTVGKDGSPALVPVWHLWRDGAALVLTDRGSRKWRNIEGNARISLCVDTKASPYRAAILEGVAEEHEGDYQELLREVSIHYLPLPGREGREPPCGAQHSHSGVLGDHPACATADHLLGVLVPVQTTRVRSGR